MIEVCDANPACVPELFELENEFPGVSVLETSCMSECDVCATSSYVFIDGKLLSADDTNTLLSQLRHRIRESLLNYETDT